MSNTNTKYLCFQNWSKYPYQWRTTSDGGMQFIGGQIADDPLEIAEFRRLERSDDTTMFTMSAEEFENYNDTEEIQAATFRQLEAEANIAEVLKDCDEWQEGIY